MLPSLKGISVMYPLTRGRTDTFWMAAIRPVYSACSTIFLATGFATVISGGGMAACGGALVAPGEQEQTRAHRQLHPVCRAQVPRSDRPSVP